MVIWLVFLHFIFSGLIECYLASNSIREAMVMANNVYKTLGANAQTLTLLATVCLEDPVTQEKAKTLLDKALNQRPDYIKAVVKKAELLSKCILFTSLFIFIVYNGYLIWLPQSSWLQVCSFCSRSEPR